MSELLHEIITTLIFHIGTEPKVRSMVTRCHTQAIDQGSRMTTMFPTNSRHWHPVMEDVAFSDAFELKLSEMTSCLEGNDEWHYISMDATMKICLKVMGQESYRAPKDRREAAPFPDEIAFRRVLTVRGRSGAVLLLHPLQGEASEQVVAGLRENFTDTQLKQVRHVAYDSPSEKLYGELLAIALTRNPSCWILCILPSCTSMASGTKEVLDLSNCGAFYTNVVAGAPTWQLEHWVATMMDRFPDLCNWRKINTVR